MYSMIQGNISDSEISNGIPLQEPPLDPQGMGLVIDQGSENILLLFALYSTVLF